MSARSKRTGRSSCSNVQDCGSRSGRHRRHCAVCRNRVPSMWSYATSTTSSGRSGTQDRSFFAFHRLTAPGSRPAACASASAQAAQGWPVDVLDGVRRELVDQLGPPLHRERRRDTRRAGEHPSSSYMPSSSDPTTPPDLCQR